MVILGVGDGIDAGAALVIDDQVVAVEPQERHDRSPRSRAFPWAAIAEVLEEAGLRNRHVDAIAVAGRFTPPLVLRKNPSLRRVARDPFSPAIDAGVFFQSLLRQSGLGALEADYAAEWLEGQFKSQGFDVQRVSLVDIHRSLAEAAYRNQSRDRVVVLTLHPMGDGAACAVHLGENGQLERVFSQPGFAALHVHLRRCIAAMGFEPHLDEHRIWALAAKGRSDVELEVLLSEELRAEGQQLSRKAFGSPDRRDAPVYRRLAEADKEVAAASVLANLTRAAVGVVQAHVRANGIGNVLIGGGIFDNPRICAAIAEIPEVRTLGMHPAPGYPSLAVGAAASLGGLAPNRLPTPLLGRRYDERQCARALAVAGVTPDRGDDSAAAIADVLAGGGLVARFQGRSGIGRHGNGTRSVLFRADDPTALDRARQALGRGGEEEPLLLWDGSAAEDDISGIEKLQDALLCGTVAPRVSAAFAERYPSGVTPDRRALLQRVDDRIDRHLTLTLATLRQRTGCGGIGCLALSEGSDPPVAVPGDAIRLWRRTGLDALALGPFLVRQERKTS